MTVPGLPRGAAHRIACAVVATELDRLRDSSLSRAGGPAGGGDWAETTAIGDVAIGDSAAGSGGLGLDSLEQLGALGALAETFDLDDSLLDDTPPQTVADWVDWIMLGQASNGGQMTVRTSGSTGSARPCVHAVADLLDEAAAFATGLRDRRRVVALVPAHHLYGIIWTALVPAALDVPIVVRRIGTPLRLLAGDLVVAVPEQWETILRTTRRLPANVVGVSSAGPLDATVAADLLAAGLTRLIDVYGSSETGGIAVRDVPAASYDLLPRWRLAALGGGDGGSGGGSGGDWALIDAKGTITPLPDHVVRIGDRALRPIGRRDGAVQVAGHNVWPQKIGAILREIDGVAEAAVRVGACGRLKAFVVPEQACDVAALTVTLDRVVAARLTAAERPRSFRFGPMLPRNVMGKLDDWA